MSDATKEPGSDAGSEAVREREHGPETEQRPGGPGLNPVEWLRIVRYSRNHDFAEFVAYLESRYGDVIRIYDPGLRRNTYIFHEPRHVQEILESKQGDFIKSDVYREEMNDVFGDGILTSDGERWMRQNKIVSPMFRKDSVTSFGGLVLEEANSMSERWETRREHGETVDLLREMEHVTLLIIGRAMFSTDMEQHAEELAESLAVLRRVFKRRMEGVLGVPEWLPTPLNRRRDRALESLEEIVYGLIEDRRGNEDQYDDLLSRLMTASDESGEHLEDRLIRDEVMTFLLAGHETTATALTWTYYLLMNNPEIHRELGDAARSSSLEDGFTPALLEELGFVKQCIQEGMRIFPPVPMFGRKADKDVDVGSVTVPEGEEVVVSQYLTHRDPEVWSDPWDYRPERFASPKGSGDSEKIVANSRPYSYYPFGGGARMCIGREFALLEATLILAVAASNHRLELESPDADPHKIEVDSAITMIPGERIEASVNDW